MDLDVALIVISYVYGSSTNILHNRHVSERQNAFQ